MARAEGMPQAHSYPAANGRTSGKRPGMVVCAERPERVSMVNGNNVMALGEPEGRRRGAGRETPSGRVAMAAYGGGENTITIAEDKETEQQGS